MKRKDDIIRVVALAKFKEDVHVSRTAVTNRIRMQISNDIVHC